MLHVKPSKLRGYISLIGGSLIQVAYGSIYSYGNLVPYFASYLANVEHPNPNSLTMDELIDSYNNQIMKFNMIYSLNYIIFALFLYYSGTIELRLGPKKTLTIASLLISFGFGLTFFSLKYGGHYTFYLCFLTLGVMWSAGRGISYSIYIVVGMRWFPNKRGTVGGIAVGMFGVGSFMFDILESWIVNPSNIKFNSNIGYAEQPDIIERVPMMCLYIALIMTLMEFISILCIANPPWFSTTAEIDVREKQNPLQIQYERHSLTVRDSLNFSASWILFIQTFLYVVVSTVVYLQWKEFAVSYLNILNDEYLSRIGSICALGNGFGRLFWGWFHDFSGNSYRITQSLMSFLLTIFMATMPLCLYYPLVMFPIWNLMVWMQANCCFAIFPSVISSTFGAKFVPAFLGFLAIAEFMSTTFVSAMANNIHSWFHGWTNYFMMNAVFALCTIFLANIYNPNIDRKAYFFAMNMKGKQMERKRIMEFNSPSSCTYGSCNAHNTDTIYNTIQPSHLRSDCIQ